MASTLNGGVGREEEMRKGKQIGGRDGMSVQFSKGREGVPTEENRSRNGKRRILQQESHDKTDTGGRVGSKGVIGEGGSDATPEFSRWKGRKRVPCNGE